MIFMYWNIRGLTDPVRKYLVCSEIAKSISCVSKIDFLYLQEVKISYFNLECVISFLWPGCSMFSTSYCHGRGGTITLIPPKWKYLLVSWGVDPSNQAVWILFYIDSQPFGIINIYASNHGPLWSSL